MTKFECKGSIEGFTSNGEPALGGAREVEWSRLISHIAVKNFFCLSEILQKVKTSLKISFRP